jgi:hypothetical protein
VSVTLASPVTFSSPIDKVKSSPVTDTTADPETTGVPIAVSNSCSGPTTIVVLPSAEIE